MISYIKKVKNIKTINYAGQQKKILFFMDKINCLKIFFFGADYKSIIGLTLVHQILEILHKIFFAEFPIFSNKRRRGEGAGQVNHLLIHYL